MRPVKYISIALLGLFLTTSCTKKQELDITMNMVEDGDLEVLLIDDSHIGLANIAVSLESGYSSPIAEGISDAKGQVIFKDVLSGTYTINAKDVELNSKEYNVSQIVQVVSGMTKSYTINPTEFSGTAMIKVRDYFDGIPVAGVNVGVFRTEDYNYNMEFVDILNLLLDSGQTDSIGEITFKKLPLTNYGSILYIDELTTKIDQYSFQINNKGEEALITVEF